MLTRHFLQQSAAQLGVEPKRISEAALSWLGTFAFPGMCARLENICHWLTVMAPAQVIEPKDLPPEVGFTPGEPLPEGIAALSVPASVVMVAPVQAPAVAMSGLNATAAGVTDTADVLVVPVGVADVPNLIAQADQGWEHGLELDASALLATDRTDVWDELTRRFESRLIVAALAATRGRRIEAGTETRHWPQHHHPQDSGVGVWSESASSLIQ